MIKEKIYLSPSRLDCFDSCSFLYYFKYIIKAPDLGNDGSNRGTICHLIFEILLNKRHRKYFDSIIKNNSCKNIIPIWKLIIKHANKLNVNDEENLDLIDNFIMVGLKLDFYGPAGVLQIIGEMEFKIEVNEDNKKYNLKGIIDKSFIFEDKIKIVDYKTSKAKFTGEKLTNNIQSFIYQLALLKLYPHINKKEFDFQFLKFADNPIVSANILSKYQLVGLEMLLTEYQKKIEFFSEKNKNDNMAAFDIKKRWRCGKNGFNPKTGKLHWKPACRDPFWYYCLLDANGQPRQTSMLEKDLKIKEGERIERKFYSGCSAYFSSEGKPVNFN